jgi:hypothetical protein
VPLLASGQCFLGGESGLGGAAYMYNARGYLLDKIQGSAACIQIVILIL